MLVAGSYVVVAVASVTELLNVINAFGTGTVIGEARFFELSVIDAFTTRIWTSAVPVFASPPILNALLNQSVFPGVIVVLVKILLTVLVAELATTTSPKL